MTVELKRPLRRQVRVQDERMHAGAVNVEIRGTGILLQGPGTRRKLFVPWNKLARAAELPGHMPARFVRDPLGWLIADRRP